MRVIGEKVSYVHLQRERERRVLSLCWTERLGYGINSHSMAALFDSDVICGNMAANRKYGMTSRGGRKSSEREREGRVFLHSCYDARLPRKRWINRISALSSRPPLDLCSNAATSREPAKPVLITFRKTKKKKTSRVHRR